MRIPIRFVLFGLTIFATACGSDSTGNNQLNITGTWTANVGACVFGNPNSNCTMTMTLAQSGTNVTGTGNLSDVTQRVIGTMTISGTMRSSNAVSLSLSGNAFDADPDDTVQYAGTMTNATTTTGTFTSQGSITGAFTFTKQ